MIRIGQIGMAHDHAEGKMKTVRKYPEIFEVVGVAEENPEVLKKWGGYGCYQDLPQMSIDELLNVPNLDAVMVETEELSLVKYGQKCIDQGIHIHLDKPAGGNICDFEQLLLTAERKKLTVQLAYMYRYNPAVQYCLEMIKSGKLGEIFRVQAIMNTYHPPKKRAWLKPFPGGNMFYLGCHMVDLVLLTMGIPLRVIPFNKATGFDDLAVTDLGFAVFEYKNGIATAEASSNEINGYGRRSLLVSGSKGTIEIRPLEGDYNSQPTLYLALKEFTENRDYADCKSVIPMPPMAGRYDAMMIDFAQIVKGIKETPYSYEYELLVQKATLAASGLPVMVEANNI